MLNRRPQLQFLSTFHSPVLSITTECSCVDFVTPMKHRGMPPFAALLYAAAAASLAVENFRYRIVDAQLEFVEELTVSYLILDSGDNLNFSTFVYAPVFDTFLSRYLADREEAQRSTQDRLTPMAHRNYVVVTCLPWMRFSSFQHPVAQLDDVSIPHFAFGKWKITDNIISFPLSVQAHHGLADAIHIHRVAERVQHEINALAGELARC